MVCMGVRVLVLLSAPLESRRTNETNTLGERSARDLGRRDVERGEGMEMNKNGFVTIDTGWSDGAEINVTSRGG